MHYGVGEHIDQKELHCDVKKIFAHHISSAHSHVDSMQIAIEKVTNRLIQHVPVQFCKFCVSCTLQSLLDHDADECFTRTLSFKAHSPAYMLPHYWQLIDEY